MTWKTPQRAILVVAWIALILPLAAPAEPAEPARPGEADQASFASETGLAVYSGRISNVNRAQIVVRKGFGHDTPNAPKMTLVGGRSTPVSGSKSSWIALRRGDMVNVAYEMVEGAPQVRKVNVIPATADPVIAHALGKPQHQKFTKFTGWIKRKTDDTLTVRQTNRPGGRTGAVKQFLRTEDTVVWHRRDSWDALRKGDRVSVAHGKGRSHPAKRIAVLTKIEENPLPEGLAESLYDPRFDTSIADVSGSPEPKDAATPREAEPGS